MACCAHVSLLVFRSTVAVAAADRRESTRRAFLRAKPNPWAHPFAVFAARCAVLEAAAPCLAVGSLFVCACVCLCAPVFVCVRLCFLAVAASRRPHPGMGSDCSTHTHTRTRMHTQTRAHAHTHTHTHTRTYTHATGLFPAHISGSAGLVPATSAPGPGNTASCLRPPASCGRS